MSLKSLIQKMDELSETTKVLNETSKAEYQARKAAKTAGEREKNITAASRELQDVMIGKLPKEKPGTTSVTHKTPDFDLSDDDEELKEESNDSVPIDVRKLYTSTYAKRGGTIAKAKEAEAAAYAAVEKKYGKEMCDKLKKQHAANREDVAKGSDELETDDPIKNRDSIMKSIAKLRDLSKYGKEGVEEGQIDEIKWRKVLRKIPVLGKPMAQSIVPYIARSREDDEKIQARWAGVQSRMDGNPEPGFAGDYPEDTPFDDVRRARDRHHRNAKRFGNIAQGKSPFAKEGVAEGSGQLTDKEILEIGTKWAKEPGWYEFERNDFVACVKEMLGDLPDKEILEIGTKWAKEPGWYEFERNDFVACVRDIESKLARPRQGVAEATIPTSLAGWMNLVEGKTVSEEVVKAPISVQRGGKSELATMTSTSTNPSDANVLKAAAELLKQGKGQIQFPTSVQSTSSTSQAKAPTTSAGASNQPQQSQPQQIGEEEIDEVAAPGQEDWIKKNKQRFISQYGKEKGLSVLYATAWKRSKDKKESVEESMSTTKQRVMEGYTLEDIEESHPHEVKMCKEGWGLDESLYEALADYYHKQGQIPRKVWHGSLDELRDFVLDCYLKDKSPLLGEQSFTQASPGDANMSPVPEAEELDEVFPAIGAIAARAAPSVAGAFVGNAAADALDDSDQELDEIAAAPIVGAAARTIGPMASRALSAAGKQIATNLPIAAKSAGTAFGTTVGRAASNKFFGDESEDEDEILRDDMSDDEMVDISDDDLDSEEFPFPDMEDEPGMSPDDEEDMEQDDLLDEVDYMEEEIMYESKMKKHKRGMAEEKKETKTGVIHKAEAGGYGRKDDEDDEGKKVKPAVKRGRGRPKKDADSETGEVKKWDTDELARWIVGSKPKTLPGKASVKHKLKDESVKKKDAQVESWNRQLQQLLNEGMTVTTSTGQNGMGDSVSVSATDEDAQELMKVLQSAGIGMGSGMRGASEPHSHEGQSISVEPASSDEVMGQLQPEEDSGDDTLGFLKKMIGLRGGDTSQVDASHSHGDYEEEDHEHDHDHDENDEHGIVMVGEEDVEEGNKFTGELAKARKDGVQKDETMKVDGKEYPVKQGKKTEKTDEGVLGTVGGAMVGNAIMPGIGGAIGAMAGQEATKGGSSLIEKDDHEDDEERCDECGGIMETNHACGQEKLDEWANSPMGKSADEQFQTELDYMTKLISGGLNRMKQDQTTLPHTKVKTDVAEDNIKAMKKLAGI
jgi:hypothetical protein